MAKAAQSVVTRELAPPESNQENSLLYRPVPQIAGDLEMTTRFVEVTPEQAKKWLEISELDTEFRQRLTKTRDVRRWKILMETDRFVHYLPSGPLCFDDKGALLNGKHRLTALAGQDKSFGFLVVDNTPRWMFRFFDTGAPRTLNDVFYISGQMTKAQTGSSMRLAMRYEEFLQGKRKPLGWKDWFQQRDEHSDVDDFLVRRQDLADWYYVGQQVYSGCGLLVAAGMAFRFYQSLAWPDGEEKLIEFCTSLAKGSMLAPGSPALVLREWSRQMRDERVRVRGKRELHLLLLFRMFQLHAQGDKIEGRLPWAYGFPMTMPYHPKGHDTAVANVRSALAELDAAGQ
jgi:hypothetical protein